ncbi:reverse transcriptase domain-containing protein [Tanacetum coccineum]
MERFENAIFKQREEINDRMTEMFGLLKDPMTSRTPEKVLIREEAKFPVTKNVNSISLARVRKKGVTRHFMGPFSSSNGNKYILVAIDYISKWVEAQAFPTSDARNIVNFLRKLFTQFRIPKALINDRGTHFYNYQMEKSMKRKDWSYKLDDALWAFCMTFKTPLGTTPFRTIYGKACHLPIELEHKAYWVIFDEKKLGSSWEAPLDDS